MISTVSVPSVRYTSTVFCTLPLWLLMLMYLTLRTVLAPGAGTMSVVVAVVMLGSGSPPGVTVVPLRSTHAA